MTRTLFPTSPFSLDSVPRQPVDWLWPGFLALGKLTLLEGDPEAGKSFVTLDLAARLSSGRPWPDGQPNPEPARALLLNAEDRPEDTVCPRLAALGGDLSRLWSLPAHDAFGKPTFLVPSGLPELGTAIRESQARLLVLDPLAAFLDARVALASEASVRAALLRLAEVLAEHRCAGLLVRHLSKGGGSRALYRGLGSIAVLATCRFGLLLARDPHHPTRRILAHLKANLTDHRPSLACEIRPGDNAGSPNLAWTGPTNLRPDDLVASGRISPLRSAATFLIDFLADGPRPSAAVWIHAQPLGHTKRTLQRASLDLGVRKTRVRENGRTVTYWHLPTHEPPVSTDPDPLEDLRPWMDPLLEQYGRSPNPLDDDLPN